MNTFLAVGLVQISVRILEIVGNIFTHMPSKPSVRPGSREALVQGLGPRDLYLIIALLVIFKELLELLISSILIF